ncbi:hypothetical protein [Roseibacillus ishigakijimensis]|uniref:Uncharacterized protein n=1 Tax=Roseibacillus ishigakijimensis TaxID=454146 RepID=A0A934RR83_9BACT|nr:hypothetical protein [Roseibacillus ishigakijimensis]MBK1832785.1 hypothetical protein [Roseibacillus ishigakijimensis]
MDDPEILALLPAIAEQLQSPETPFVKEAYEHLLAQEDIEEEEARYMLAFCLADEIEKMNREERGFDLARYQMLLSLLPALPE